MVRRLAAAVGALLACFHVWLFAAQIADGRLTDPGAIARWLVAFGVVGVIWHLQRRQVSLVVGRRATAIWLLAAILHAPAAASRLDAIDGLATADVAGVVLQVSAVVCLTALVLSNIFDRRFRNPLLPETPRGVFVVETGRPSISFLLTAPRPPPAC